MGMGSITKSFVAATILLLMEDGLLNLDDPAGMYLDPYPNIPPEATIRQLLSHRSGIYDYMGNPELIQSRQSHPDSIWETDTLLYHYVLEPIFSPGTEWSYSSTNYLLLGRLIEHLTHKPWYEVVRDRMIDPLGLTHTYCFPFESPGMLEMSHCWADLNSDGQVEDMQGSGFPVEGLFSVAGSAGCLITTPEDLVRFSARLYGGHVVNPVSLDEMKKDYTYGSQYFTYGLGALSFKEMDLENWGHDGNLIYRAIALYFPEEEMSLAVQQNDNRSKDQINFYRVFDALLDTYLRSGTLENGLKIFPNPTSGVLHLEVTRNTDLTYPTTGILINMLGQQVRSFRVVQRKTELYLGGLSEGIYFLSLGEFITKVLVIYRP